jgi:hypothetical protein
LSNDSAKTLKIVQMHEVVDQIYTLCCGSFLGTCINDNEMTLKKMQMHDVVDHIYALCCSSFLRARPPVPTKCCFGLAFAVGLSPIGPHPPPPGV